MSCKMNCQAFSSLLQQCGNRNINIIENVCCLEVEVKNIEGCYFANVLKTTCLKKQDYLLQNPATYVFLVDKKTFSKFFIGKLIEKLIERLKKFQNIEDRIIEKLKKFQNVENEINTLDKLDKFFKELEEILKNENLKEVGNNNRKTDNEKLREELKRCLNLRNYNYFPLYVGGASKFPDRYNNFILSLWSGMRFPHVFGGKLHEHLRKLPNFQPNFQPIEMCLVVFYTDSENKAKCIEHFILKHPNFYKIFNDEDGNCPKIQEIKRIAKDIENEAEKIIKNKKAENIEEIFKTIKQEAGEIKNEAEKISNIAKETKDIKEKAENIKKILETIKEKAGKIKEEAEKISNIGKEAKNIKKKAEDIEKIIKEKSEEIINAIQIANKVIKTIQKLESCP